jgi:hypothetical protein
MGRHRQLSISLEEFVRARIEECATKNGRSLGDEVRARLWRTLQQDALGPMTRELMDDVGQLARGVGQASGVQWHKHPKAHEALTEAVVTWLAGLKPPAIEGADTWGTDDPKTVGRVVVRSHRRGRTLEEMDAESSKAAAQAVGEASAKRVRGRRRPNRSQKGKGRKS